MTLSLPVPTCPHFWPYLSPIFSSRNKAVPTCPHLFARAYTYVQARARMHMPLIDLGRDSRDSRDSVDLYAEKLSLPLSLPVPTSPRSS